MEEVVTGFHAFAAEMPRTSHILSKRAAAILDTG
jgi:hypothetical protein